MKELTLMAYNFNKNFEKYINSSKGNDYKYIVRYEENTQNSNSNFFNMENIKNKKLNHLNNPGLGGYEEKLYRLDELDNPNGWDFTELDMLGEMGYRMDDDFKMYCEIEIPSLELENEKMKTFVYKTDEGYVIETSRKYVFETFNKLLEYIDSIPMKQY